MAGIQVLLSDRNNRLPSWATHDLQSNRYKRNHHELPRYVKIEGVFSNHAKRIVNEFKSGRLTKKEAMKQFAHYLKTAETHAFVSGKRASGVKVQMITPEESKMLTGRHSRNMRYFSKFLNSIEEGATRMPIDRRADMYAKSLWSLYNRGQGGIDWTDPDPDIRYMWVMDFDAEHCECCIKKFKDSVEKGGYTFDELIEIGFPGENCDCCTYCRCHIQPIGRRKPKDPSGDPPSVLLKQLLEGDNDVVPIPLAGVSRAFIEPKVIAETIHSIGSVPKVQEFLTKLPEVMDSTLLKPASVAQTKNARRIYSDNDGTKVEFRRGPNGLWYLVRINIKGVNDANDS